MQCCIASNKMLLGLLCSFIYINFQIFDQKKKIIHPQPFVKYAAQSPLLTKKDLLATETVLCSCNYNLRLIYER